MDTGKKSNAKYCPECARLRRNSDNRERRSWIRSRYGIGLEEYDKRMQGAVCALCGTKEDLCLDHCHATGRIRGILCRKHNAAVGALGDSVSGVWRVYEYLLGIPIRPGWDEYYLMLAEAIGLRADCTRSKVGAVAVARDHTVIGAGYVGVVSGQRGCLEGACPRGQKSLMVQPRGGSYDDCISKHAEVNTISHALETGQKDRLRGGTIYVTRMPCDGCMAEIQKVGMARIVWPGGQCYAQV